MYILRMLERVNKNNCCFVGKNGYINFVNNNPMIPVKKFTVEPASIYDGEVQVYAIRGGKNTDYAFIDYEAFEDLCPEITEFLLENGFAEICMLVDSSEEPEEDEVLVC